MDLRFEVYARIARPVSEVFDAVVNPTKLSQFFTTGGASAPLREGSQVVWDFADFPGAFPVDVTKLVKDREIVLKWEAAGGTEIEDGRGAGYQTTVDMRFEPQDDGSTIVRIAESGWRETAGGLTACIGNAGGWTHMLACLKAWIEHGIRLRDGYFKA
jgi:uncharacterized protein YndB with AHSA1/START domain